jgi:hypothetical protein
MPNLTFHIPDADYAAARAHATSYRASIASVVADFLFTLRNLSRENANLPPAAAAHHHCNQLRKNRTIGRVNLDPFTDQEFLYTMRYAIRTMRAGNLKK